VLAFYGPARFYFRHRKGEWERWPSRLVAAAAEERLNIWRNPRRSAGRPYTAVLAVLQSHQAAYAATDSFIKHVSSFH
jgi:hypothetical protein